MEIKSNVHSDDAVTQSTGTGKRVVSTIELPPEAVAKHYRNHIDMYNDPLVATIREIGTNGLDGLLLAQRKADSGTSAYHTAARCENLRVGIRASYNEATGNIVLSISDNGIGMPGEFILNRYTNINASSKSDSNDERGGFGYGSKTPYTLSDAFQVVSTTERADGSFETTVADFRFADDQFGGEIMNELEFPAGSDVQTGTTVTVEITRKRVGNVHNVEQVARRVASTWPEGQVFVNDVPVASQFSAPGVAQVAPKVYAWDPATATPLQPEQPRYLRSQGSLFVVMGDVWYPIDRSALVSSLTDSTVSTYGRDLTSLEKVAQLLVQSWTGSLAIVAEVGDLKPTPSRDGLVSDGEMDVKFFREVFSTFETDVLTWLQKELDAADSVVDALKKLRTLTATIEPDSRTHGVLYGMQNVYYRGEPIELYPSVKLHAMRKHAGRKTMDRSWGKRPGGHWVPVYSQLDAVASNTFAVTNVGNSIPDAKQTSAIRLVLQDRFDKAQKKLEEAPATDRRSTLSSMTAIVLPEDTFEEEWVKLGGQDSLVPTMSMDDVMERAAELRKRAKKDNMFGDSSGDTAVPRAKVGYRITIVDEEGDPTNLPDVMSVGELRTYLEEHPDFVLMYTQRDADLRLTSWYEEKPRKEALGSTIVANLKVSQKLETFQARFPDAEQLSQVMSDYFLEIVDAAGPEKLEALASETASDRMAGVPYIAERLWMGLRAKCSTSELAAPVAAYFDRLSEVEETSAQADSELAVALRNTGRYEEVAVRAKEITQELVDLYQVITAEYPLLTELRDIAHRANMGDVSDDTVVAHMAWYLRPGFVAE